ncbi:MAG: hypothetical protein SGPRY_003798 [Prymnesium sp.]
MLSCVSLFIYLFTKLSVSVFSGATVLSSVFGWQRELAAAGLLFVTAAYTAMGGLAAVIVTDVAQSAVLLAGAMGMAISALYKVGGMAALMNPPPPGLSGGEWATFFRLYRPAEDEDYPTAGMLLGLNVGGLWYWCLDQAIVQRVLSAKSEQHAKASTVFAGFLKITPVFLMVFPGIVVRPARKLFAEDLLAVGCPPKCNGALPLMMTRLLPSGLLGLNLAATVAACMSSLDSVFTAAASLFCLDLYKVYLRPDASERRLVVVGRIFCCLLAVGTMMWLPVIDLMSDQASNLLPPSPSPVFTYIQSISMYLAPPIVTVYFLGVLWWRANAHGATAAFVVGYLLGFGRMAAEIASKIVKPAENSAFEAFVSVNYLYVGVALCGVCLVVHVVVSLLSPRPRQSQIHGLVVELRCLQCIRRFLSGPRFKMHPAQPAIDSRAQSKTGKLPMLGASAPAKSHDVEIIGEKINVISERLPKGEDKLQESADSEPHGPPHVVSEPATDVYPAESLTEIPLEAPVKRKSQPQPDGRMDLETNTVPIIDEDSCLVITIVSLIIAYM